MIENIDIVSQITGDWGRWQFRTVFLIYLSKIPSAWFMACIIFTSQYAVPGEYVCKPTENIINENVTQWIFQVHPLIDYRKPLNIIENYDYCNVYDKINVTASSKKLNQKQIKHEHEHGKIIPCDRFEHDSIYEHRSMVPEFDLVCSRKILIAVSQFFHLFGVLTGGIIATKLLEHFSPKHVMFYGMVTQVMTGCITGLVYNFNVHMLFRCIVAICCALMYTAGQVIFTDITGGKYRLASLCFFDSFWSIGVILLPALSHFFPNWSNLYLAISLPTCGYIILWCLIPNSPRWLLRKGLIEEAEELLKHSAQMNDREHLLPYNLHEKLIEQSNYLRDDEPKPSGWLSLWDTPKSIIYMIALHIAWAIYVTNFNGMLLNIRAFGRDFLTENSIFTGIFEILGVTIAMLLILNTTRKWMWTGLFSIFAGFFACTGLIFPTNISDIEKNIFFMITAMVCKTAVSCSQSMLLACTSELVPADKKKMCLFSCIVWARIWLLTAPFIGVLSQIQQVLGLVAFGVLTAIGGAATCILTSPKSIKSKHQQMTESRLQLSTNMHLNKGDQAEADIIYKTRF